VQASAELRERLLALYEAMSSGNADRVEAFYSLQPGSVFVGTDEAEFWTDSAKHNADVRHFFDGSNGVFKWLPGNAAVMVEGQTGWTIDRVTLVVPDDGEYHPRVTLVWHREDGVWKVVHSHASFGR
jgi:ketosteroid isomerase-like protein